MGLVDIQLWNGTHTWCHGYREGLPWWRWGGAPSGLCTRSQVHAAGRRLARGQDPCGLIVRRRGKRTAALYRLDQTAPSRRKTPALLAAVEVMERARRTCRSCGETRDYRMPTSTKTCWPCMEAADAAEARREMTEERTREGNRTMTEPNDTRSALIPDAYATAEEVWEDGYDHVLALALHEQTGWPIVGLEAKSGGYTDHYMVRRPDGMLVDAKGARTQDDVLEEWAEGTDFYSVQARTVEAIRAEVEQDPEDVLPLARNVASSMAPPVEPVADGDEQAVGDAISEAKRAVEGITTENSVDEQQIDDNARGEQITRWNADDQSAEAQAADLGYEGR